MSTRNLSVKEVIELSGLGRNSVYGAINSGALQSMKIGGRRLISERAYEAWLSDCVAS